MPQQGALGQSAVLSQLWQRPEIVQALSTSEWSTVLREVVQTTGASQTDIAAATGISQPHVSRR